MKKLFYFPLVLLAAGIVASGIFMTPADGAEKKVKAQTICPVMGDPINKKFFVDYKGYRVYFCCASCPDEFKKNPEKYMKKLRESGVTLEKSPKRNKTMQPARNTGGHSNNEHHAH